MKLLPAHYSGQKILGWTIPYVTQEFEVFGQECKAVLVLDNCLAHPDQSELVSEDGKIIDKFLPTNINSAYGPESN